MTEHWQRLIQQSNTRPNRSQLKSLAEIDDMLRAGEGPTALVFGQSKNASGKDTIDALVLTTQRILYRGRLMGQQGTSSFRLDQVDSVSSTSGLLLGSVVNGDLGPASRPPWLNYPAVERAFWATARGLELQENPRVKRLTTSGGLG